VGVALGIVCIIILLEGLSYTPSMVIVNPLGARYTKGLIPALLAFCPCHAASVQQSTASSIVRYKSSL
jgi:hypothetical protein